MRERSILIIEFDQSIGNLISFRSQSIKNVGCYLISVNVSVSVSLKCKCKCRCTITLTFNLIATIGGNRIQFVAYIKRLDCWLFMTEQEKIFVVHQISWFELQILIHN